MNEIALIGKKIGMTREFYKTGQSVPVTVIKMEKARVIQVIEEDKRGYKAVQLGYGKIKNSKLTKAMKGFFTKKNTRAVSTARVFFRILSREIRQAAQISFSNDLFHLGRTLHARRLRQEAERLEDCQPANHPT